jgi:hypothetical protein
VLVVNTDDAANTPASLNGCGAPWRDVPRSAQNRKENILSTYYICTLSVVSHEFNVSGHMLIWKICSCFGMWNQCPKLVRIFQLHFVYIYIYIYIYSMYVWLCVYVVCLPVHFLILTGATGDRKANRAIIIPTLHCSDSYTYITEIRVVTVERQAVLEELIAYFPSTTIWVSDRSIQLL